MKRNYRLGAVKNIPGSAGAGTMPGTPTLPRNNSGSNNTGTNTNTGTNQPDTQTGGVTVDTTGNVIDNDTGEVIMTGGGNPNPQPVPGDPAPAPNPGAENSNPTVTPKKFPIIPILLIAGVGLIILKS